MNSHDIVNDLLVLGEWHEFPRVLVLIKLGAVCDLVLLLRGYEVVNDEQPRTATAVVRVSSDMPGADVIERHNFKCN